MRYCLLVSYLYPLIPESKAWQSLSPLLWTEALAVYYCVYRCLSDVQLGCGTILTESLPCPRMPPMWMFSSTDTTLGPASAVLSAADPLLYPSPFGVVVEPAPGILAAHCRLVSCVYPEDERVTHRPPAPMDRVARSWSRGRHRVVASFSIQTLSTTDEARLPAAATPLFPSSPAPRELGLVDLNSVYLLWRFFFGTRSQHAQPH